MERTQMTEAKLNRLTMALAICEEFARKVELTPGGRIVVMIHEHWMFDLENRLRQCNWRFIRIAEVGPFRILTLVDSFR
jgi:hypothetical protein